MQISATKTIKNAEKTAKKKSLEPKSACELMSVTALSRLFDIDRATIRTRIDNAGIKPVKKTGNETLYEYTEELETVLRQDELEAAKLQKLQAEAAIKEHELAVKKGEFASVAEFTEIIQKVFGKLHKKTVVQLPKRIAARLHNANSETELAKILETELANIFHDLRGDFTKFL